MGASVTQTLDRPSTTPKKRTQGPRVIRFIEQNCVHPDGELIGQPLIMHPWWKQRVYEMFELKPQVCPVCGEITSFTPRGENDGYRCAVCTQILESLPPDERRYAEAVIGIAKKNGKTSVLAALGLYFLIADDDPSALVVSAAASEEQGANLLYGSAKIMCELSPTLAKLTVPFDKEITVPSLPRARMRNVASKAGTQDGQNIKALLMDELHEWLGARGRNLFTVLSGGVGARFNAMRIAITTAGYDQESLCYEKYDYGKKVNAGEIDDPGFYFYWLEPPQDADYRDPKVWAFTNPLLGVSVREKYIEDRVKREPESVVRRYNTNQWVATEEIWIPTGVWDKGLSDLDLDPSLPLYVGIDIAKNIDSSALALAQRHVVPAESDEEDEDEDDVRYVVRATIWANPYPEHHELHDSWRMNNNLVMDLCRDLFARFPVPASEIDGTVMPGPMFAYDPWRFRPEAEALTGEGLAMVEFPQNDSRMIPASQDFYEAIMKGEIAHDGDQGLKRHVHAVTADQKPRGWRMTKPVGSKRKIDAAIATAIAVHCAKVTPAPATRRSMYSDGHQLVVVR